MIGERTYTYEKSFKINVSWMYKISTKIYELVISIADRIFVIVVSL